MVPESRAATVKAEDVIFAPLLMLKTGRLLFLTSEGKVMDYFLLLRNILFSLEQQDILFAEAFLEILRISIFGGMPAAWASQHGGMFKHFLPFYRC